MDELTVKCRTSSRRQGFDTDETRWKVRHTAGAKALDFREIIKMPISG